LVEYTEKGERGGGDTEGIVAQFPSKQEDPEDPELKEGHVRGGLSM
jgi:hypothetical protein